MTDRLIRLSSDWAPIFRARIAVLGWSHLEVDQRAGLADGHTNKILNGRKMPGALTIEKLCRALNLALAPVVDGVRDPE